MADGLAELRSIPSYYVPVSHAEYDENEWQRHGRWNAGIGVAIIGSYFVLDASTLLLWAPGKSLSNGLQLLVFSTAMIVSGTYLAGWSSLTLKKWQSTSFIVTLVLMFLQLIGAVNTISSCDPDILDADISLTCRELFHYYSVSSFNQSTFLIFVTLSVIGNQSVRNLAVTGLVGWSSILFEAIVVLNAGGEETWVCMRVYRCCISHLLVLAATILATWTRGVVSVRLHSARKKNSARQKSERIMNHNIKNILASSYALLLLFTSGNEKVAALFKCAQSLKQALFFMKNALDVSKIHEGTYVSSPQRVDLLTWFHTHTKAGALAISSGGLYLLNDGVVAALFRDLSLSNAFSHGGGDVKIDCHHRGGVLNLDIHNSISSLSPTESQTSQNQFSTGLGISDLNEICDLLGIPFQSGVIDDRWHASIQLTASVVSDMRNWEKGQAIMPSLPQKTHIAIVDDQRFILRFAKMKLEQAFPSVIVETYLLDTQQKFEDFAANIHTKCRAWDILVMDQHLQFSSGSIQLGTNLLQILRAIPGHDVCCIMHSGNNSESDTHFYMKHGAHGVVGKGANLVQELPKFFFACMHAMSACKAGPQGRAREGGAQEGWATEESRRSCSPHDPQHRSDSAAQPTEAGAKGNSPDLQQGLRRRRRSPLSSSLGDDATATAAERGGDGDENNRQGKRKPPQEPESRETAKRPRKS